MVKMFYKTILNPIENLWMDMNRNVVAKYSVYINMCHPDRLQAKQTDAVERQKVFQQMFVEALLQQFI